MKSANSVMSFRSRLKCFLLNMSSLLSLVPYIGWLTTLTRIGYLMLAYIVFAGHANELGDLLIKKYWQNRRTDGSLWICWRIDEFHGQ